MPARPSGIMTFYHEVLQPPLPPPKDVPWTQVTLESVGDLRRPLAEADKPRDAKVKIESDGPLDPAEHSKWPTLFRVTESIMPKMFTALFVVTAWASVITSISMEVMDFGFGGNMLTVTGFVVGLAISFRTTTAYAQWNEARRYFAQLSLTSRSLARIIWNGRERHSESPELGKRDVLDKLAAINLLKAFAIALKYRLRFEPSLEHPDLSPYVSSLDLFSSHVDPAVLRSPRLSWWRRLGRAIGIRFASPDPRQLLKSNENLGNAPLEILNLLSSYMDHSFEAKLISVPAQQTQMTILIASLTDVLTGTERIVNTPLPASYKVAIAQLTWIYVLAMPIQLLTTLGWLTIPATLIASFIILSLSAIGSELENPFTRDKNGLPLDLYCREICKDIHMITAVAPVPKSSSWLGVSDSKVIWPESKETAVHWEGRSLGSIRHALKSRAFGTFSAQCYNIRAPTAEQEYAYV